MDDLPWIERRGRPDAILEVVFDEDEHGGFAESFSPHGDFFGVPLEPDSASPYAWDCRLVIAGLDLRPLAVYRLDAHFLSPSDALPWLPVGSGFTMFPGRRVGRGIVLEWLAL